MFTSCLCVRSAYACLRLVQVTALRRQASLYRRQAWGTNFSRDHLNQLLSEHNALWEPTDSDPPTPRLTSDPRHNPDRHISVSMEALDLPR